jgi:hypothetical protein
MVGKPAAEESQTHASLSGELADLLIDLSSAFQKHSMYPPGHPALAPALAKVTHRLSSLLSIRGTLVIAVARDQLIIEGVATDREHPLLGGLAERLYRHQLGVITFTEGITESEIAEILALVAEEPERTGRPLGREPLELLTGRPHVRLHPLGYEKLQIRESAGQSAEEVAPCSQLWILLAEAALADEVTGGVSETDPSNVARAIDQHVGEEAYDQVITGYVLTITREIGDEGSLESDDLRERLSRLVSRLETGSLGRLLQSIAGSRERKQEFLLAASRKLAPEAVLRLLEAAAHEETRDISDSMTRVLSKLARHASAEDDPAGADADAALREHVQRMISDWELENANAEDYDIALRRMAAGAPLVRFDNSTGTTFDPERIAQMSLELDVSGEPLQRAVEEMIAEDSLGALIELLDDPPSPAGVADEVWHQLARPETLRRLTASETPDFTQVDRLLPFMGLEAADPLLDALAISPSRSTRWKLLERLELLGPELGPRLVARLDDHRWYVVRNMLTLLGRLTSWPPDFSPEPLASHEHAMVRLEALKLCVRVPEFRAAAVVAALSEENDRLVAFGLTEIEESCPPHAMPHLQRLALDAQSEPGMRTSAIRSLVRLGTAEALETLLEIATLKRLFLRRDRLPPTSPELVAALRGLRERWPTEPRAERVLAAGLRSSDTAVRVAAEQVSTRK